MDASLSDDEMLKQLEQQQQVINALLETRKMLIQQQLEASAGLAQQMAALSFNMETIAKDDAKRKKRRAIESDEDHSENAMRLSGYSDASWACSSFEGTEGLEALDGEEDVVYRSCGHMNVEAQWQAEAQKRQACLKQLQILGAITMELEASDVWVDPSAASSALTRLVDLSGQLTAARQEMEALEIELQQGQDMVDPEEME